MDAEEISKLVEELEERVERLRVLYDQYFMGIEKIPPDILKKDVDRRMWVLRREKIRNTGVRFKFQMITQRLNTFQSYWMRICREIENGTFKRDLARARRRFGSAEAAPAQQQAAVEEAPAESYEIEVEDDTIVGDDLVGAVEVAAGGMRAFDDDLDEPLTRASQPPPVAAPAAFKAPFLPPVKPAQLPPQTQPAPTTNARPPIAPPPQAAAPKPALATKPISPPPVAKKADAQTTARIASTIIGRNVRDEGDLDAMLDAALGSKEGQGNAKAPAPAPAPALAPAPAPAPAPALAPAPAPAPARPPAFAPSPANAGPRPPPGGRKPAVAVAKPPEKTDPDRQIYARYVEAKRKNGESTANVTFEALQRNLEATRAKLKEKSGGRSIEFDVVVKDGKTILRPIVK